MTEHSAREHLLGRLPESERDLADEKSITDRVYFESLTAEEQLLIEEYVEGEISPQDRVDFEEQLRIRPELKDRVALERMARKQAASARTRNRWLSMLLPLAATLAAI